MTLIQKITGNLKSRLTEESIKQANVSDSIWHLIVSTFQLLLL